ncbi:MAG: hypothetical protein ACQ5SW_07880 [Sphaerochaetaceae bacterium]
MKRMQTCISVLLVLAMGMVSVAATPTAEEQFTTIQSKDLSSQSLDEIKASYDKLNKAVANEAEHARKRLSEARAKGDRDAFYEARDQLSQLSLYSMDQDTSDYLLEQILALEEPKKSEYAAWLYEHSPYYRPTLTLDFSAEGETYRYSYRQQISKVPGSEVTLPSAGQLRLNSAHLGVLVGWGLTPDEVTYQSGETIEMRYTSQTLYAIYKEGVQFVDSLSGTDLLVETEDVAVPTPVTDDASAIFAGWYDKSTGTLITDPTSYERVGKGGYFEALWKRLAIEDITVLYYDKEALPTNTQIGIGFSYANTGTVGLAGLTATLQSESEYVRILNDKVSLGLLEVGLQSTNNSRWATSSKQQVKGEANTFRFLISPDAPSGTVIPFSVKVTNDKGDTWTQQFSCVVR